MALLTPVCFKFRILARAALRWFLVLALFRFMVPALSAGEAPLSETQVKAAFLVNFTKYVEWPEKAFSSTNAPFVIAVRGDDGMADELSKMIDGRSYNGHPLSCRKLGTGDALTGCQLLFVSATEQRRYREILDGAGRTNANVLTVGESSDFLEKGGILNLARQDKKITVEVSLAAARKAELKISSKLLGVAQVRKDP